MSTLPKLDSIAVRKVDVDNRFIFECFLSLFDMEIISEENDYYIVDGNNDELKTEFKEWWGDDNDHYERNETMKQWKAMNFPS